MQIFFFIKYFCLWKKYSSIIIILIIKCSRIWSENLQIQNSVWVMEKIKRMKTSRLVFLGNLTLAFYVTMVPQRIVTILYYEDPQICCSPLTMNVCYYLAKVSSIAGPVICLGTHKTIQRSIQVTNNTWFFFCWVKWLIVFFFFFVCFKEIVLCHRGAVDINSSDSGKVAKNLSTEDHHIN